MNKRCLDNISYFVQAAEDLEKDFKKDSKMSGKHLNLRFFKIFKIFKKTWSIFMKVKYLNIFEILYYIPVFEENNELDRTYARKSMWQRLN